MLTRLARSTVFTLALVMLQLLNSADGVLRAEAANLKIRFAVANRTDTATYNSQDQVETVTYGGGASVTRL